MERRKLSHMRKEGYWLRNSEEATVNIRRLMRGLGECFHQELLLICIFILPP